MPSDGDALTQSHRLLRAGGNFFKFTTVFSNKLVSSELVKFFLILIGLEFDAGLERERERGEGREKGYLPPSLLFSLDDFSSSSS